MTTRAQRTTATALVERAGRTYADDAGITLKDTPAPLFDLLVLSLLLSARISADIAVAAARELFTSDHRTPQKMADASWQDLVDALGRGHYVRYDESTATRLGDAARRVLDDYHGDLRELAERAGHDTARAAGLLQEFTGIGPVGADGAAGVALTSGGPTDDPLHAHRSLEMVSYTVGHVDLGEVRLGIGAA